MFDPSAAHIAILLIVVVLLFGATRLPRAAKSLGQSISIFKKEIQNLNTDDKSTAANPPEATAVLAAPPDPTQQQLLDLQRQVADLQRQSAGQAQADQTGTSRPL
jgi:sec-independent protein translocase protein TatA